MILDQIDTLPPDWAAVTKTPAVCSTLNTLHGFLQSEHAAGKTIYPAPSDIFNALKLTPLNAVRLVILGQDPYHGEGQAHGLSFSVRSGIRPPPSLKNIYKEIARSTGQPISDPNRGDLTGWARQGVLLLNAALTVEAGLAGSHQNRGWEIFTDAIIMTLNDRKAPCIFLLWGSFAQKKVALIDRKRHHVLEAPHPSPLSAHRGFLGCNHFVTANDLLRSINLPPIDWHRHI